jgi:hypothetical protein
MPVVLEATTEPFKTFSAEPGVGGSDQAGEDDDFDGEHGDEDEGEHSGWMYPAGESQARLEWRR